MTRQEAINHLKTVAKSATDSGYDGAVVDAVDMAREALEQEPCGKDINVPATDAISRQAVLDKLNRLIEVERLQGTDEMGYGRERVSAYECMIHAVESEYLYPTIQPQPKTGHWIPVSEKLPDKEGYYLCSVRYMYPPYNFFKPEKVKYMDDVTIQKFDGEFNIEVKAWMPLPEPYKAERSGEE